ncbi:kinesin, partial [Naegleria gruberi]
GFNVTMMAYGQTGAGKTYTMIGSLDKEELFGLIPRTAKEMFEIIRSGDENIEYKIGCSFLEIYNEKINDLFDKEKRDLTIIDSPKRGVYVDRLTEEYVTTEDEMLDIIKIGNNNRLSLSTRTNQDPAQSHSIFIIRVESLSKDSSSNQSTILYMDFK